MTHKIFDMAFGDIYQAYIIKVERKERTRDELDAVICWLTGLQAGQIHDLAQSDTTMRGFFAQAKLNPAAAQLKGSVCGVKIQEVEDPLMRQIRYMDKLVDDLAKGRKLERMLPTVAQ